MHEDFIKLKKIESVKNKFIKWIEQVPVVGFNSARYDINIIKFYLVGILLKLDPFNDDQIAEGPLKTNNKYRVISSKHLKFLDIYQYIAPNYSLDEFIKAYTGEKVKGVFPYEWMTSYDKLYETSLPEHALWFSTLKNKNITDEVSRSSRNI